MCPREIAAEEGERKCGRHHGKGRRAGRRACSCAARRASGSVVMVNAVHERRCVVQKAKVMAPKIAENVPAFQLRKEEREEQHGEDTQRRGGDDTAGKDCQQGERMGQTEVGVRQEWARRPRAGAGR